MKLVRKKNSHKGQNGRVLVVGGNELYHGAPILTGLGAEKSGVDLVYLMIPVNQQNLARQFSANLIVDTFFGKYLRTTDLKKVLVWTKKVDVMIIGNGLGEKPETLRACKMILQRSKCDIVVDAAALSAMVTLLPMKDREVVLTPHRGEFGRLLGIDLGKAPNKALEKLAKEKAKKWGVVLVLKTPQTLIVSAEGQSHWNTTGNPIMTKGGTGDVLAGIIGGLMAQGLSGFEAAKLACTSWGKVGEQIFKKKGLMTTVEELVSKIRV